jgi:uncharacterized protein YukE
MAQAIVDPAEIRRFAHHLKVFSEELRDRMAVLRGQLAGLGDSWRDQEHERFVQEFEQTAHVLEAFVASAEQHVPFLARKAAKVEEYLHQK